MRVLKATDFRSTSYKHLRLLGVLRTDNKLRAVISLSYQISVNLTVFLLISSHIVAEYQKDGFVLKNVAFNITLLLAQIYFLHLFYSVHNNTDITNTLSQHMLQLLLHLQSYKHANLKRLVDNLIYFLIALSILPTFMIVVQKLLAKCPLDDIQCALVFKVGIPDEYLADSLLTKALLMFQVLVGYVYLLISIEITLFAFVAYISIAMCYNSLCDLMKMLPTVEDSGEKFAHFKMIVQRHQDILSAATDLNELSRNLNFLQVMVSVAITSLLMYKELLGFDFIALALMATFFVPIMLFSTCCEILIDANDEFRYEIYKTVHLVHEIALKRDMMFMMHRCNHRKVISVGKFASYTRPFALKIMKWTYSIFTILIKFI